MSDKTIVITGEQNIKAVQAMARARFWRLTAQSVALGFKPRKGFTIRAFNAEYGQKAKTWADVVELTNPDNSGAKS